MLDGWTSPGSNGAKASRPAPIAASRSRSDSNMRWSLSGGVATGDDRRRGVNATSRPCNGVRGGTVFARIFARIVILALVGGVVGLAVGLIGKYALKMAYFDNPFWAVAAGIIVG